MPKASRVEEELNANFENIEIKLIKSSGGTFKVIANKEVIFDKLAISEYKSVFPKENEISNILRSKFDLN